MIEEDIYSLEQHGNFYYIAKNGKKLTTLFDSYEKPDLTIIVGELNELSNDRIFFKSMLNGISNYIHDYELMDYLTKKKLYKYEKEKDNIGSDNE